MTPQLFFYIIRLLVFSLYSKLDLILISKSKRYIVGFFRSYSLAVGANNLLRVLFFGGESYCFLISKQQLQSVLKSVNSPSYRPRILLLELSPQHKVFTIIVILLPWILLSLIGKRQTLSSVSG